MKLEQDVSNYWAGRERKKPRLAVFYGHTDVLAPNGPAEQ
jgi:acetylornithine deacetylase/succinyl-diaminopimelate desuccinylase-like protein